ncbi:hypothetical protein C3F22_11210 [Acinetobacter sp. ACNIH1]|nr:hypothetical protein C3F22_11210 [Acinetobacter sp. ACNIH1]HCL59998.1 hypothetical protein [Acinetobacter sp.]
MHTVPVLFLLMQVQSFWMTFQLLNGFFAENTLTLSDNLVSIQPTQSKKKENSDLFSSKNLADKK